MDHGPTAPPGSGGAAGKGAGGLVMLGRKKDMIIRGKTNIYPGLYEPLIAGMKVVAKLPASGRHNKIDRVALRALFAESTR